MGMKRQNIELHIEKLVLHGFSPGDRHRIAESVERELAMLIEEQGAPQMLAQNIEIVSLQGGKFDVKQGSGYDAIVAAEARSIYGGLKS